jgi:hypothetical protein
MTTTNMRLEEEFFAVEGRPQPGGNRACAYVSVLEAAPNGDSISAEERAALWSLAYWSQDGIARPSIAALSMHLDLGLRETRTVLRCLIYKGVLCWLFDQERGAECDVQVYEFAELR